MKCKRFLAAALAAAMLPGLTACSLFSKKAPDASDAPAAAQEPVTAAIEPATAPPDPYDRSGNPVPEQRVGSGLNPLTGMPGYDADYYAGKKLVGVVVENHPGARPQWGMSTPDVTFEYEVEGGISRMFWLYANPDELPAMVGPVRSMRHDIVELARGFDLVFVHCGGSYLAREKLASYNGALTDFDEMSNGSCFFRNTTRDTAIEHRLILKGDAFREAYANLGARTETDEAHQYLFKFADVNAPFRPSGADCARAHIEYSGYYTYTFDFNEETALYEASINGSPRLDDLDIRCAYKNVVILYVDMERAVPDDPESKLQDLHLERGGRGVYISNGGRMDITWEKGGDTDMLKLFDANGSELVLNAGRSYIGLVRSTQSDKTELS